MNLDNLKKAQPLAESLDDVRKALNEMNQAPAYIRVYGPAYPMSSNPKSFDVKIPNVSARAMLKAEEKRLVAELAELGVSA